MPQNMTFIEKTTSHLDLVEILHMSQEQYTIRFSRSPIKRDKLSNKNREKQIKEEQIELKQEEKQLRKEEEERIKGINFEKIGQERKVR